MYSRASKYLKSMCAVAAAVQSSLAMSKLAWKWENTTKTHCRGSNMCGEATAARTHGSRKGS